MNMYYHLHYPLLVAISCRIYIFFCNKKCIPALKFEFILSLAWVSNIFARFLAPWAWPHTWVFWFLKDDNAQDEECHSQWAHQLYSCMCSKQNTFSAPPQFHPCDLQVCPILFRLVSMLQEAINSTTFTLPWMYKQPSPHSCGFFPPFKAQCRWKNKNQHPYVWVYRDYQVRFTMYHAVSPCDARMLQATLTDVLHPDWTYSEV